MTTMLEPLAGTVPAEFEKLDDRFSGIRGDAQLERLWTGGRWLEGPVYSPAGRYLLFSDIPNDRILRWDETSYQVSVFRQPAGNTNGHTLDEQGRLVSCEHGNRRVTRTEHDGRIRVLADNWDGKRLNSPNDVVVADGRIRLVHGPGVRDRQRLRGVQGRDRDRTVATSTGSIRTACSAGWPTTSADRTGWRSRTTAACSTSPTPRKRPSASSRSTGDRLTRRRAVRRVRQRRLRRDPARRRGPDLGRGRRRRPRLPPGRHPARQAAGPGNRLQPLLRRRQAQPSLPHRDHLALLPLHHGQRRPPAVRRRVEPGPKHRDGQGLRPSDGMYRVRSSS